MTKQQLEEYAAELEAIIDNEEFYSEDSVIEAETEICKVYKMLQDMQKLEEE